MRARFQLPERYLVWVGGLRHPDPGKHVAELAATPRELPLVLVGPTRPWAHELPDVILTGQVSDEHLAAIYSGAHALVLLLRATRASGCRRWRRSPAARPWPPATCRRCARCSASARRSSPQGTWPR